MSILKAPRILGAVDRPDNTIFWNAGPYAASDFATPSFAVILPWVFDAPLDLIAAYARFTTAPNNPTTTGLRLMKGNSVDQLSSAVSLLAATHQSAASSGQSNRALSRNLIFGSNAAWTNIPFSIVGDGDTAPSDTVPDAWTANIANRIMPGEFVALVCANFGAANANVTTGVNGTAVSTLAGLFIGARFRRVPISA